MGETYESIRDGSDIVPQDVRLKWKEADHAASMLRLRYAHLEQDADLTPEAKSRKAQELYEQQRARIEGKKQAAKDALIKAARSAARGSIPRPAGEATTSTDPTKLLLDQNEANRVVRVIERRKGQGGPFQQGSSEYLREEYERGMEVGGVEGGSICRGVLRAAQELGMGDHWLPRSDAQHEMLDRARRLEYFSGLIDTKAPKPPKSFEKAAKAARNFGYQGPGPLLVPASGGQMTKAGGGHTARKKAKHRG